MLSTPFPPLPLYFFFDIYIRCLSRFLLLKRQEVVAVESELFEIWNARVLQHWWRATHKNLRVFAESWKMIFNHFLIDETSAVIPRSRRSVQGVPELKPSKLVIHHFFQLVTAQNVVFSLVCIQH